MTYNNSTYGVIITQLKITEVRKQTKRFTQKIKVKKFGGRGKHNKIKKRDRETERERERERRKLCVSVIVFAGVFM